MYTSGLITTSLYEIDVDVKKENTIRKNLCVRKISNLLCFLLGNSPASEFYMPTFRNSLSVPSSYEEDRTERVFRNAGNSDAREIIQKKSYYIHNSPSGRFRR